MEETSSSQLASWFGLCSNEWNSDNNMFGDLVRLKLCHIETLKLFFQFCLE